MKKLFLFSILALATTALLFSCKKKDKTTPEEKNQTNIVGTWNLDKTILNSFVDGQVDDRDTTIIDPGSTMTFSKENKYYQLFITGGNANRDTGTYIINGKNIKFQSDGFSNWEKAEIQKLTKSSFILFSTEKLDEHRHDDTYIYLSK